jgi:hypothetical protein
MLVKWVSLTLWQNQVCAQDFLSGPLKASLRAQALLEPDSYDIHFRRCRSFGDIFSLTSKVSSVNFIVSHSVQRLLDAYMYVCVKENLHFHSLDTTSQAVRYKLWTALKSVAC